MKDHYADFFYKGNNVHCEFIDLNLIMTIESDVEQFSEWANIVLQNLSHKNTKYEPLFESHRDLNLAKY